MLINIKELDIYYLNTNNGIDRRKHMEEILTKFNLIYTRMETVPSSSKLRSISSSSAKVVITALTKYKEFKPFIVLEDDVDWYSQSDEFLELKYPEDTDAIYLGISNASCDPNFYTHRSDSVLKTRHVEYPNLFRIYNMLSGHAILFLSHRYALAYLMSMMEAIYLDTWCDTITCRTFPQFNIYALAQPLFYQSSIFGGQEEPTRVNWTNERNTTELVGTNLKYHNLETFTNKIFTHIK